MILKKFEELPENMKNDEVLKYYNFLSNKKGKLVIKRLFDIVISCILLIILTPIMLLLAIVIKVDSKGPVFYRQERVTQYGKIFRIFKFRTMIQNADKLGSLVTIGDDPRITRIGKIIRKCRLDEIPQLINVFKGEMSFVGTRPEVKKYVDLYNDKMKATLLMPAGITSIASIHYKNEDDIISKFSNLGEQVDDIYINRILPEKMKFNFEYIKKFSFIEDIKICIKTLI